MADLFRQSIGMKNLKYCAAVGGFATLRMRHAPCGYTKYSCVFHTSTCQKISRRPLLLIESELPDTLLFRGAAWDKCKMESGKFPAARHEGLTSNENIRLTAGPRMLYTDTGGPQPVRLQENPPSQKFRREEKCERKPSGFPFAFHHPPQRQNCKIIIQNSILQF